MKQLTVISLGVTIAIFMYTYMQAQPLIDVSFGGGSVAYPAQNVFKSGNMFPIEVLERDRGDADETITITVQVVNATVSASAKDLGSDTASSSVFP